MSGILDSKTRFLDTILTQQGREQLAAGGISIKWVTFSDINTFYFADTVSGSADCTDRIYLETSNNRNDQLTFLANDHGQLIPFPTLNDTSVLFGKIVTSSSVVTDKSKFASLAEKLFDSSLENFKKLYTIGSIDPVFDDTDFILNTNRLHFAISDNLGIKKAVDVNTLEKFHEDSKLSNLKNFMFLPPINKISEDKEISDEVIKLNALGSYKKESWSRKLTYGDISKEINVADKKGQVQTIRFEVTSRNNNILCQFFEQNQDELLKLDIIDYGEVSTNDINFPKKHVYFVGKIVLNDQDTPTFINLYTLIFE